MELLGVSKYLETHGYKKKVRQKCKNEFFSVPVVKSILKILCILVGSRILRTYDFSLGPSCQLTA